MFHSMGRINCERNARNDNVVKFDSDNIIHSGVHARGLIKDPYSDPGEIRTSSRDCSLVRR